MSVATYAAVGINVAVGLLALVLAGRAPYEASEKSTGVAEDAPSKRAVFVTIALSGACALGAEVVWTRLLAQILGPTTYAFSTIVSIFIIGIAIGAAAPAASDMANTPVIKAEGAGLKWTAPAHWQSKPAAAMRKATYAVPGDAGAVGAGHRMKLLHNFVSLGLITLIAEAAACAKQSGIGSEVFVDVLARGGGGGVALERLKPYLLTADTGALRFSVANARKDLGYYGTMAADTGADRTVADAVLDSLTRAAHAEPEAMVPELVRIIAAR